MAFLLSRPESGHTERDSPRFPSESAGIATVLFHPDFDRRLRSCTESADPSSPNSRSGHKALAGLGHATLTAGGDCHPALRTSAARDGRPAPKYDEALTAEQAALAPEPACPHAT